MDEKFTTKEFEFSRDFSSKCFGTYPRTKSKQTSCQKFIGTYYFSLSYGTKVKHNFETTKSTRFLPWLCSRKKTKCGPKWIMLQV